MLPNHIDIHHGFPESLPRSFISLFPETLLLIRVQQTIVVIFDARFVRTCLSRIWVLGSVILISLINPCELCGVHLVSKLTTRRSIRSFTVVMLDDTIIKCSCLGSSTVYLGIVIVLF